MEVDDNLPQAADSTDSPVARWTFSLLAVAAFLLLVHNYGINLLPSERLDFIPERMHPLPGEKSFAYIYRFNASEPDLWLTPEPWFSARSRTILTEDGQVLHGHKAASSAEVPIVGGGRWAHEPGRILFSSSDNSDPRTNGRVYAVRFPILYKKKYGYGAALIFGACVATLYLRKRREPPRDRATEAATDRAPNLWRPQVIGAAGVLLVGLYLNTGTLSPYGNTHFAHVVKDTGYLYNTDHPHFKVLFDFVNGADKKVWDRALFLRRILFPVLAWPLMRLGGFEVGGTVASLLFSVAAFGFFAVRLRHHIGERGAIFAAWLLALYPGATYWGGLPYPYAMIFPGSLLLMLALLELREASVMKLVWLSLGIGALYLGYDLAAFFLPATVVVLLLYRRPAQALLAAALQLVPTALWLAFLTRVLDQPLANSNTAAYGVILNAYLHIKDYGAWLRYISYFPNAGFDIWFGANFIFLPALLLAVVALNPLTSRIRPQAPEAALLLVGLGLFLFNNLAPDYYGLAWVMRGTWISRLYQPLFPALIVFAARWWQHLPAHLGWRRRTLIGAALAGTFIGNALVVFGPALSNPWKISEAAFYKFYDHNDVHWVYEANLKGYGRRPLGFPRPQP